MGSPPVGAAQTLLGSSRPQPEMAEFSVTTSQSLSILWPEDSAVSKTHLGPQFPLQSTFSQAKGRERGVEVLVLKAGRRCLGVRVAGNGGLYILTAGGLEAVLRLGNRVPGRKGPWARDLSGVSRAAENTPQVSVLLTLLQKTTRA